MFEFIEQQITHFLILTYNLLKARLNASTLIDVKAFTASLAILLEGYGVSVTVLICAIVETIAIAVLVFTHFLEGTIMSPALPFLLSRFKVILYFVYVAITNRTSHRASRSAVYIESTFTTRPAIEFKVPALCLLDIAHYIFTFLFSMDFLVSTISYFKILPCRVSNYATRQLEMKILNPCKREFENMKMKYPMFAFALRLAFRLFVITACLATILAAFLFVCLVDLAVIAFGVEQEHGAASIEEALDPGEDAVISLLSITGDGDSSTTLSIMATEEVDEDATLCCIEEELVKFEGSLDAGDSGAAVIDGLDESESVEDDVFEDALESVFDEQEVKDLGDDGVLADVEEVVDVNVDSQAVKVEVFEFARSAVPLGREVEVPKVKLVNQVQVLVGLDDVFAVEEEVDFVNAEDPELARRIVPLAQEVGPPRVQVSNQKTRAHYLTPFAGAFVPGPKFKKGLEASIHAPSGSIPSMSISTQDAEPPKKVVTEKDGFRTSANPTVLKGLEASMHAPTSRTVDQTRRTSSHWSPAPAVSVVLEAPRRRGGRGSKAGGNKEAKDVEITKPGEKLSRRQRHLQLMGAPKSRPQIQT
ncbi:hypothetical protein D9613_005627 [Agrocybe pediades]|uniref:Uncharacterized protein n=1 Tax=Agrocybe pediades TaxID=84607 RepID=A0A8H4QVP2_9AGAR|nr:hypothetical protein D9613_005627 [Agrocybe pediades]